MAISRVVRPGLGVAGREWIKCYPVLLNGSSGKVIQKVLTSSLESSTPPTLAVVRREIPIV